MLHLLRPVAGRGIAVAVLALCMLPAIALAAPTTVVGPKHAVGGRSYAQWLEKFWKITFATPPGGPICHRVGNVVVLTAVPFAPGPNVCTIRARRTLYVNGPSAECSDVEDPPYHGDTPAERKSCAKAGFKQTVATKPVQTIDGKAISHIGRFYVHTHDFAFTLPKNNILASKKRHGHSTAYGAGFLVEHLKRGKHTITGKGEEGGQPVVLTYKIHVVK